MKMAVEVENEYYAPLVYNTPPHENQESAEQERENRDRLECQRRESELIRSINLFRKWAKDPENEDLRSLIRGPLGPADLRNRKKDLRETLRRASGHDDLRNRVLNRDRDLRIQLNRRRASSVPANLNSELYGQRNSKALLEEVRLLEQSVIHRTDLLDFSIARTEERMRDLRDRMEDSDTKSVKTESTTVMSPLRLTPPSARTNRNLQRRKRRNLNPRHETHNRAPQEPKTRHRLKHKQKVRAPEIP
jgi:hypothetical protein